MAINMQQDLWLETLANKLGGNVSVKMAFGDPVEHHDIIVIPVAKAYHGFGGGYGQSHASQAGRGAGAGGAVLPMGYIEISQTKTRYKSFRKSPSLSSMALAFGAIGYLLLKAALK